MLVQQTQRFLSEESSSTTGPAHRQNKTDLLTGYDFQLDTNGRLLTCSPRGQSTIEKQSLLMMMGQRLVPVSVSYRTAWMRSLMTVALTNKQVLCTINDASFAPHAVIRGLPSNDVIQVALEATALCPKPLFESYSHHYGLTQAEAMVLWMLSEGHEPKRISMLKGTAESTVRSQIKSILEKTGEHAIRRLLIRLGRLAGAQVVAH